MPPGRPPRSLRRSACRLCWAGPAPATAVPSQQAENRHDSPDANMKKRDLSKDNGLKEKIAYCLNLNLATDSAEYPKEICDACFKNVNKFFKYKLQCERADARLRELFLEQGCTETKQVKLENDCLEIEIKDEPFNQDLDNLSDSLDDEPLLNLKNEKCKNEMSESDRNTNNLAAIEEHSQINIRRPRKTKDRLKLKTSSSKKKSPTYCNICRSELGEGFAEHMKAAHGVEDSGFKCFGCEKLFRTRKSRLAHEINFCKGLKEGYRCEACVRFLPSRGAYEAHAREHRVGRAPLPDALFKCAPCDKLFKTRANLQQHMAVHKETKNFVCEVCGRVFNRQDYLRKHILTHTGQKQYVCPHCGFRATQKSSLTVHIRKHTGERPFSCDVCHLKCISSSNLLAHRRRHDGLKKFECSLCGKKFGYKLSLEEHMASTHERLKTHGCRLCGATYTRQRGLRRHARVKHGADYGRVASQAASAENLNGDHRGTKRSAEDALESLHESRPDEDYFKSVPQDDVFVV